MKSHIVITILLLLLLSGCASKGPGDKYLKQISNSISSDYKISKGELIAKYNLLGIRNYDQCVFAKDYGMILSDEAASQKFLESVKKHMKNPNILSSPSEEKIKKLYDIVMIINAKYNVVSRKDLKKLQQITPNMSGHKEESPFDLLDEKVQKSQENNFSLLVYADNLMRYVPIFLPQSRTTMTSPFGSRKHPLYGETLFHQGADFAASKHAKIYSSADGNVLEVGSSKSYGNFILIEHGKLFRTRYAHLSKIYVSGGEKVFQGELIGLQGMSGNATGDHLHFEVIYKSKTIDPMFFVGSEYYCRKS